MSILHHGSELTAFDAASSESAVNSGSTVSHTTTSGVFDSDFVRAAIQIDGTSISSPSVALTDNFWLHFVVDMDVSSLTDLPLLQFYDQNDELCLILASNNGDIFYEARSSAGGAFAQIGPDVTAFVNDTETTVDINVDFTQPTTRIEHFLNGVLSDQLIFDLFGDTGASTGITRVEFLDPNAGGNDARWSEIILADEVTIGMRVRTLAVTAIADFADFTGSIIGVAGLDPGTLGIVSDTVGDEQSFALEDTGAESVGLNPISVGFHFEAQPSVDPTEPQNISVGLRQSGTNFAQLQTLTNAGINRRSAILDFTNPITGAPWTLTDLNTMQLYFRSEA